jgi:hypothetical protein
MLEFIKKFTQQTSEFLSYISYNTGFVLLYLTEKLYDKYEQLTNWWNPFEVYALKYTITGNVFDISGYVKNIIYKKYWLDWHDIKSENTDFVEVNFKIFGKNFRFIFNDKYNLSTYDRYNHRELVYAILQHDEGLFDVTDYLKEYQNIPVSAIEYKFIEYHVAKDISEYTWVDLIVSKINDQGDEITYKLKTID